MQLFDDFILPKSMAPGARAAGLVYIYTALDEDGKSGAGLAHHPHLVVILILIFALILVLLIIIIIIIIIIITLSLIMTCILPVGLTPNSLQTHPNSLKLTQTHSNSPKL